jgi:lysophospholipid acyltransferase
MYVDWGGFNMDSTTYTMILVTKLWGLSLSYKDGAIPSQKLSEDHAKLKVVYLPTVMQYLGYVFFCCGALCSPFIDFVDFKNWVELQSHYSSLKVGGKQGLSTFKPAFVRFGQALACLATHFLIVQILGFSIYFCGTDEFVTYKTFLHRVAFYYIAMTG